MPSGDARESKAPGLPLELFTRWPLMLAIVIASVLTGASCAAFLSLLESVTSLRFQNEWLILLLPIAGLGSGWMYSRWGTEIEAGNNLVFEEIREPSNGVAFRITPMVLIGTLTTHLFGGSAGREGTAVQMAAGIGDLIRRWFGITDTANRGLLLQTSVAAGFAGVFGTPVAGALFAMEVLRRQKMETARLPVCLLAAVIGDQICLGFGASHTKYSIRPGLIEAYAIDGVSYVEAMIVFSTASVLCGAVFGAAALAFCRLTHWVAELSKSIVHQALLRPAVGGLCVTVYFLLTGGTDYLGLGVESAEKNGVSIVSSFQANGAGVTSWIAKLCLTSITVGTGFKGGEVTPLFFIGATLGNSIAALTGLPPDLLAGLGFVCLFAAATKTPVTSLLMSVELFGGNYLVCFAIAIGIAVTVSGHVGIYRSPAALLTKAHSDT